MSVSSPGGFFSPNLVDLMTKTNGRPTRQQAADYVAGLGKGTTGGGAVEAKKRLRATR